MSVVDDRRGVALIEFAFVLPFLVLLFLGGYQLMDAISVYRKVGSVVRTLSDLTTQNTTITNSGADEILNASRQVMTPYSSSTAAMRISQIQVDSNYGVTVTWSRGLNSTPYAAGSAFSNLPGYLYMPNRYYILSEITYNYTPNMASSLIGTIPLTQVLYMSPRNSPFIAYN